jgi:hypothetical protein
MASVGIDPARCQRPVATLPLAVLALLGATIAVVLGGAMVAEPANVGGLTLPALALGLPLVVVLVWALPGPTFAGQPLDVTWRRYLPLIFGVALALLALQAATAQPWQFLLAYIALEAAVSWLCRASISGREVAYAAGLAFVAGVAGLGSGRNAAYMPLPAWGLLNVGLTFFGCLAGWALMRRVGLLQQGMGEVWLLSHGPRRALRAVLEGILLALPFAIAGVALGTAATETWVRSWWQTLVALQPGIAEEAWARVFLLPALMYVLLRGGSPRAAWLGAVAVGVYWFLNLHNNYLQVGGLAALVSTLVAGTLFGLPLTYVWLRRGFEAAVGFHFAMDFGKFVAALLYGATY